MTKKFILALFVLGLMNTPTMAFEENTIDLNLEDMIKNMEAAPTIIEFDVPSEPLLQINNAVKNLEQQAQEKVQEVQEIKEDLEQQAQEKVQEVQEVKEDLEQQAQEKVQEVQEVKEDLEQQAQEKVQEVQEVKEDLEQQAQEKVQEIQEVKEDVEQQTQEKVQDVQEVKEDLEQQAREKVQETISEQIQEVFDKNETISTEKSVTNEDYSEKIEEKTPSVIETKQSEGEVSDDTTTPAIVPIQDDEIRLESSIRGIETASSKDFSNAPKWEDFCESGYENANLKEKENIFNIINFVNAERIKSNYWAERRANFEKAVSQCNEMNETARNYCYEGVKKSETERNEIYERQRKQINYKNQGIKIDK